MNNFMRYIPTFFESKDMVFYVASVLLLSLLAIFCFGKLGFAYQNAMDTKEQITSMTDFVNEWNDQVYKVNKEPYRPVRLDQVDDVQSNILLMMTANQLNMNSFKTVQEMGSQKNPSGSVYEMEIEGNWDSTVRILENFHVRDALISINSVKLVPTKNAGVKTTLVYKIYTKNGTNINNGK